MKEKLNLYNATEIMDNYVQLGVKKTSYPIWKTFLLGIFAGIVISFGAVASSTAVFQLENYGLARFLSGLIFPFGLGILMLTGTELFTGNCMIVISALEKKARILGVIKNWVFVYLGNLTGSLIVAGGIVYSGQMDLGGGKLAVYAIKTAAAKSSIDFGHAIVLGVFCNILVCLAVLCSLSAKDTIGRILGAYIPVSLFVIGGYEHCVANMYYIPAGIFASMNPSYSSLAIEAGIDLTVLTVKNFLFSNLLPVTIGNMLGGVLVAISLWAAHGTRNKTSS